MVLSLSWEEERWKCFKDHYSGVGQLLLGLKLLWMIAGATRFKTRMEKDRRVDWHLCAERWLARKRDGWKYWFCLFSTCFRTDGPPPSLQGLVAGHGSLILAPCLINSPYHLPRAHSDCFLGSTVTARSRVGIKGAYCRLLWRKHVSHTLCSEKLMSSRCSPHSLSKSVSFLSPDERKKHS